MGCSVSFWLSLAHSPALSGSLWLPLAHSGSPRLSLALYGSLRLSLALYCSPNLLTKPLLGSQGPQTIFFCVVCRRKWHALCSKAGPAFYPALPREKLISYNHLFKDTFSGTGTNNNAPSFRMFNQLLFFHIVNIDQ